MLVEKRKIKQIINFYRIARNNIGDYYSAPIKYFNFLNGSKTYDIAPRKYRRFLPNLDNKIVIIGGGGLIGQGYFESKIKAIISSNASRVIFWGAGHNIHGKAEIKYPDYLNFCHLVGVRDYGLGYEWVPCPSCLHKAFDKKYAINNGIIIYENSMFGKICIEGYPKMGNNVKDFETVIKFLASGEIVLTSSYHGAYWAVLLNKKVVVINPWSTKFYGFKYKIPFADHTNWYDKINDAVNYPLALKECREANLSFAKKVEECACS